MPIGCLGVARCCCSVRHTLHTPKHPHLSQQPFCGWPDHYSFLTISLFHNRLFFNASNIRKLSNLANLAQKQIGCQHVLLSHQHEQALPVTGDGTHCSGREDTGWVDSVNAQNRVNICLKNINTWYDQEKKENGGSFSLNFWSELGLLCRPLWQSATCKF